MKQPSYDMRTCTRAEVLGLFSAFHAYKSVGRAVTYGFAVWEAPNVIVPVAAYISKPLRRQMKVLIDRTRWPVLVTYSDEGLGHTGHVYIQRWEHRACAPGQALAWMQSHGWRREAIQGKVWASGNQAHRYVLRCPTRPKTA